MRAGRAYWRRKCLLDRQPDNRPRWSDIPEDPEVSFDDDDLADDYDRLGMMMKIDAMDRAWRDLVNEYGFTPVINAMSRTTNREAVANTLQTRRNRRQMDYAVASVFDDAPTMDTIF